MHAPSRTAQPIAAPLTRSAIFLVVTLNPGVDNCATVRSFCGDLSALVRAVEFRDLEAGLSCVVGFGSNLWDRLLDAQPGELHAFREIRAGTRHAVSTPGDVLFHIRAKRMDMCFELATQIMTRLENVVSPVDEVHGFRYFDDRDLLGFVDGTENPRGEAAIDAVTIGEEDAAFAGGSYVIVQKYLHDLDAWNTLSTEVQERIIGRTKLSDIELDDSVKPTSAHNALTTIVENGKEVKILRDNMPFGRLGTANSAHISSATAVRRAPSNRCSKTCSSVVRPATTIACSTSAALSPETYFSFRPRHFWMPWARTSQPWRRLEGRSNSSPPRERWLARHWFPQRRDFA